MTKQIYYTDEDFAMQAEPVASAAKHTPGPWIISNGEFISDENGVEIARVDSNESDARLFAAAPDLASELAALVARCDGAEGVQADGSNMDTRGAHAALEKAGL